MNIVVIGGGSAGRTAAIEAAAIGENVTLIEMDKIGGKCLNTGCMVVCGLNDVARFIKDAQIFNQNGIISTNLKIDFEKVSEGIINTTNKIREVITSETEKAGVNIVYGNAEVKEGFVLVDDKKYPYDKLIIATGSYAFIPHIKGVEYAKLYKNVLDYKEIPEKLIIIGSGTIATEFAGIFSALGSKVHILSRGSFLKKVDPDIKDYIVKKLLKEVEIHQNLSVNEIYSDGVLTKLGRIEGDVLLAVGMVPNSEIVKDLVETGANSEIIVNKMMETSHPNIYAAGDVVGSIGTTPVARMEGVVAARNACGISAQVDYRYIPSSISLYYDVSYINTDEKGVEGYIPGSAGPGAFWNVLNRETGITKAVVDIENGGIKGVSSISPSARTILAYISKFMRDNKKIYDFEDFIESHPSTDSVYKLMRYFSKYE
ncbi:MAG: NAD(P)/FAD-dependent oxidoreductase [Methanobacterium sp.]|nr:NAD(P)/FAD-dependent oxidoreductase [Methanobacterium sp.]